MDTIEESRKTAKATLDEKKIVLSRYKEQSNEVKRVFGKNFFQRLVKLIWF